MKNDSSNDVATQRNDLLHGQQTFTLIQKRIFALALQQIERGDDTLKMYTVNISDLIEASNSKNVFKIIEEEADSIMKKILYKREFSESGKRITTRWNMVSKVIHNEGKGTLSVRINDEIRDMLLDLKGRFTSIPVTELMSCRSTYGQRLYEMLYSEVWRGNKWTVPVEDLRFSLNLEEKYRSFTMFRERVLKKAQKDLQKNTNMRFTWTEEARGKGKKITHLNFEFHLAANQMSMALEPPKNGSKFDIYDLRNRLKTHAQLTQKQIDQVMNFLEKSSPEKRDEFKKKYYTNAELYLQQGRDENNRPIKSRKSFAWERIESLIS